MKSFIAVILGLVVILMETPAMASTADADGEKILDTLSTFGPAPKPSPGPVEP